MPRFADVGNVSTAYNGPRGRSVIRRLITRVEQT